MAKTAGVAVSTVQAIWKAHGLSPHRWTSFKLSTDPAFVDKLTDIVALYVAPPAHAAVLSVDEKSQIQARDRTQPGLPLKKGRGATMTHDYKRNGTTTLFAALNVLSSTPFVFIGLYGVTEEQYGFLFAAHVAVMTVGAYINSRIVERFGLDPIIRWGAVWAATMGCVVLFFAATGIGGVAGLLIPFALMMFAVPLVSANAVAGAMGEFPHVAGTAAALNGMVSFALGSIGSTVVGYLYNDTALPMGAGICAFGVASLLVYLFVLRGAPPPTAS